MFRRSFEQVGRLFSMIGLLLIRGYRLFLSPWMGHCCRFHPSCSEYALDALNHCHFWRAIGLIFYRLIRCHPFHPGGSDPVPVNLQRKKR